MVKDGSANTALGACLLDVMAAPVLRAKFLELIVFSPWGSASRVAHHTPLPPIQFVCLGRPLPSLLVLGADVELVFSNAILFNGAESWISKPVGILRAHANKKFAGATRPAEVWRCPRIEGGAHLSHTYHIETPTMAQTLLCADQGSTPSNPGL